MYLAIAAIIGKEALYLKDWIDYHYNIGVTHFYLYTYKTDADTEEILQEYERQGLVTYYGHLLAGPHTQMTAYDMILAKKLPVKWLAFIDADEFIVPKNTDWLPDVLKDYEQFSALAVHWRLFGSNGLRTYDKRSVVERFTRCQADVNPHLKCIVQPSRTSKSHTPHSFIYSEGAAVDENKVRVNGPLQDNGSTNIIQINHYATKSYEECKFRRAIPRPDNGTLHDINFFMHHDRNDIEDTRALVLFNEC